MKKFEEKYILRKQFDIPGGNSGSEISSNNIDTAYPNVSQEEHDAISLSTQKEIAPIKKETIQARLTKLEQTNPVLYRKLMASGKLKNSIENTKQLEKLTMYLEYLNYLYNVTRVSDTNPSETSQEISKKGKHNIVKKYRELLSEKTDFIEDKEFLQYKYMEAIIRDIKRMGYFVQKDVSGSYIVKDFNTGKEVDKAKIGKYIDVFKIGSINNHAIDTALLANVIVSNKEFEGALNQKEFINKLFEKYGIISNIKDEDKTNYLIVKGDKIKKQISTMLLNSKSGQEISELSILQNFVENKTWKDNSSYNRFNKANTYAKGFLTEKAFIDAYKSGKLPGLDDPSKSTEDQISEIMKNNQVPAVIFGILAMLFGFKKTGLGAIGFGLFGGAAADLISDSTKVGKDMINGTESIIKPIEKDQIARNLSKAEYQDKYQELVAFNSKVDNGDLTKSGDVYIDDSMEQLDAKRLNQLIEYIVSNGIDLDLSALNIVDQLKDKLAGTTKEELESLVSLLKKSGIKEDGDKTILDYLTRGGRDILNRPFDAIYPTTIDAFDTEITSLLRREFDKVGVTRDQKRKILKLKEKISTEFSSISGIENKASDIMNGSNLSSNKAIDSVLSYVRAEFPSLEDGLKCILTNYDKYKKAENELKGFEGLYDESILEVQSVIQGIFKTENLTELHTKADNKIKKLEAIKIVNPLGQEEPFVTLNSKIDTLIANLEKSKKELLQKAKDTDIDIVDNGISNPVEIFNLNPEKLFNDITSRREAIKEAMEDIKSDKTFNNITSELEAIEDNYKILTTYSEKLTDCSINTGSNEMAQAHQDNVLAIIKKFNDEKTELKEIVKSTLEKFYKSNAKSVKEIGAITITLTDLSSSIEAIKKAKEGIKELIKDDEAKKTLEKAKEIFGDAFEIIGGTPSVNIEGNTVDMVKVRYNEKKLELGEIVRSYLISFIVANNVADLKEQAKKLSSIKYAFSGSETINNLVEEKGEEVFTVYTGLERANESKFKALLDMDIKQIEQYRNGATLIEVKQIFTDILDTIKSLNLGNMTIQQVYKEVISISEISISTEDSNGNNIFKLNGELGTKEKFFKKVFSNIDGYENKFYK